MVDVRSTPHSPSAPDTRVGVRGAAERWKPGVKTVYHVPALWNTRRDSTGKRTSPPIYVDEAAGFARLEGLLREHGAAVIFCACSYRTHDSPSHRCLCLFVADEMRRRISGP